MTKFRVSPRIAVMLAIAYSVIYIVFSISMILGTFLFIELGFYWLAASANAVLIVPSALFVLIWREIRLLKSTNYISNACHKVDASIAVPAALIGTWKLLKSLYRSLKSK
jgi:hypothetical protein